MQFLYPDFLWGLFLVAIPIAIHLLQLRRPQRVLFTNTEFIREVELTTMRRRRLQEILVLLARALSLVFLVLMFAQPFILPKNKITEDNVGIFLDTSSSMRRIGKGGRLMVEEAALKARALGKSYEATAHFQLLSQSNSYLTQATYLDKIYKYIDTHKLNSWGGIMSEQREHVSRDPLYIFSDFQRSAQHKEIEDRVVTKRPIVLVPQAALPVANIYVDSVWLSDAFVRTQANIELHIRLRNGGASASDNCSVKVRLGTRQVAAFSVSLLANAVVTKVVQIQLSDKRTALGQVTTSDSPITFDNAYYFALQPTATITVAEIGNEPVAKQAYGAEALFAYSFMKPQQVDYAKLQQADLVMVREVATVSTGLREALMRVVRRGGSVVVVPPAEASAQGTTTQLLRALGVGPVQWKTTVAGLPVLEEVAMPNLKNSFFRDVFGAQPRQVVLPQVAPVLSLGGGGADILRLRDGESYLAEFKNGVGKAYVFTAPFAAKYSNFTTQSLFVPVLYRLAMLSLRDSQQLAYRLTIPVVNIELPPSATNGQVESAFRLVKDSLTFIPTQRIRGTDLQVELPADMSQPGFYRLQRDGKDFVTLAFNQDSKESELASYSAAELRQLFRANPNVQVLDDTASPEALLRYRAEQTGQSLWRSCLLLVLVCLLAEVLLLRFGKSRVPARLVAAE